ncbi:MAG: hypothetical protein GXO89_04895 [Chlorobi bacterium]|nr:hypothetical protein [Chlorobiota bacterium]
MYEKGFSAHSGAENLIAANYLYATLDKNYIPTDIFKEKKTVGKLGNMAYRFAKFWYIDFELSAWAFRAQHEYFGHTVRAKQAGYYDAWPVIGYPYYSKDKGLTYRGERIGYSSNQENKLINSGGTEANIIIAENIFIKTLLSNRILYQQSLLYIGNNTYQSLGILLSNNISDIQDIKYYNKYVIYNANDEKLQRQFKTIALIELLTDPMNYVSLYSIFKNYIYEGKHGTKIPMLRIGKKIRYLPDFRYVLASYSPELMYENYFRFDDKLLNITIRHAALTSHKSFGVTASLYNYSISKRLSFDTQVSYWTQPEIKIYNDANEKTTFDENSLGLAFIQSTYYRIVNKNDFSLMIAVGYKTGGYLEGEILDEGLILRGGLSFRFEE